MPGRAIAFSSAREDLVVALAQTGDRRAFEELVRRRQGWIRNLMRRCCRDVALADDLAQQVFLQAFRDIGKLRHTERFAGWLKRLAINTWLQHQRKQDVMRETETVSETSARSKDVTGMAMDLDRALASLSDAERLCVVLSYHEGMSHAQISRTTDMPLGTVKSHVRRGSRHLQEMLAAYADTMPRENG